MSAFGEHTPQQNVLRDVEEAQLCYDLTDEQLIVVLLEVLHFLIDPYGAKSDAIREKTI